MAPLLFLLCVFGFFVGSFDVVTIPPISLREPVMDRIFLTVSKFFTQKSSLEPNVLSKACARRETTDIDIGQRTSVYIFLVDLDLKNIKHQ